VKVSFPAVLDVIFLSNQYNELRPENCVTHRPEDRFAFSCDGTKEESVLFMYLVFQFLRPVSQYWLGGRVRFAFIVRFPSRCLIFQSGFEEHRVQLAREFN
jgi:hypothetical protein